MNWYKVFYWLTVADNAKAFFIFFIVLFAIWSVVCAIGLIWCGAAAVDDSNSEGDRKEYKTWQPKWSRGCRYGFPFLALFWALYIFTPSKEDSLVIICGGAVGEFVTSDSSSAQIPADLTRYLHLSFQKEIADLDEETKKDLGLQSPKEELTDKLEDLTKEQILEYLKTDTSITVQ